MNLERSVPAVDIQNGVNNGTDLKSGPAKIPKVNDVIGKALPKIGAYKQLDNKKQVVALIDDVSFAFC